MKRLRFMVLALIVTLAVFFNLERLDLGYENSINIQTFVYVLGLILIIVIISLPKVFATSPALTTTFSIGMYILCKLLLPSAHPAFGGIYSYVTITEVTLLALLVWLATRLSSEVREFQVSVERITITETGKRVMPLETAARFVENEMLRCRRYERPLTVMVIEPDPKALDIDLQRLVYRNLMETIMNRYVTTSLGNVLSDLVRGPDLIMEQHEPNRFVILCPETTTENSSILAERIQKAVTDKLNLPLLWGMSEFPSEALTFEELIRHAASHLERNPTAPVREKAEKLHEGRVAPEES